MKKFLLKTSCFVLPIFILGIYTYLNYNNNIGDLLRIGYIPDLYPNYKNIFTKEFQNKINFTSFSEKTKQRKFKVLTIGDSFSQQNEYGFQNYLSKETDISVLHLDRFITLKQNNQIQSLYNLLNGDFFENYHFEYVILENVERHFIDNIQNIDSKKSLPLNELNKLADTKPIKDKNDFVYNSILKFPYYSFKYQSNKTFLFNKKVYKTQISKNLFSINNNQLLFYYWDVGSTRLNNEYKNLNNLNNILNDLNDKLLKKGIKLIVLAAPDKYDVFYDYIVDKHDLPRPLFFEQMKKFNKKYIWIKSKEVISSNINQKKDLYFYDDTHWSPWSSKIIADEILSILN